MEVSARNGVLHQWGWQRSEVASVAAAVVFGAGLFAGGAGAGSDAAEGGGELRANRRTRI